MRYVPRLLEKPLEEALNYPQVTAIVGPRRSGKSTVLKKFIENLRNRGIPKNRILMLDFDSLSLRERLLEDESLLGRLIEEQAGLPFEKIREKFYLFLDEVQKAPFLFDVVKRFYDRYSERLKIFFSGSSSLDLYQLGAESLAGRLFYLRLYPYCFKERLLEKGVVDEKEEGVLTDIMMGTLDTASLREKETKFAKRKEAMTQILKDMFIWGGFPEVVALSTSKARIRYLEAYQETYLEKDIRAIPRIYDLRDYRRCMGVLAHHEGHLMASSNLAADLGIDYRTFRKYVSILQATMMHFELFPYILNARRRLVKSSKGYMMDLGLVSYLTDFYDWDAMLKSGTAGRRMESLFVEEALKRSMFFIPRDQIFFWRTSNGIEVDLVVLHERTTVPVELKLADKVSREWISPLKAFRHDHAGKKYSVVIYSGSSHGDEQNRILYCPAYLVF